MQIESDHISAVTVPLGAVVAVALVCGATVKGCQYHKELTTTRINAGQVEVYDPPGRAWVWRYATNQSPTLEKK